MAGDYLYSEGDVDVLDDGVFSVDSLDIASRAYVDMPLATEILWRVDDEVLEVADDVGDEVRQAAENEGYVGPPLQDDDFSVRLKATSSRRGAHAGGAAPDDKESLPGVVHDKPSN